MTDSSHSRQDEHSLPPRIGGWLNFFAASLVLSLIISTYYGYSSSLQLLELSGMPNVDSAQSSYDLGVRHALIISYVALVFIVTVILFCLFVTKLLLGKKKLFPKAYIYFNLYDLVGGALFVIFTLYLTKEPLAYDQIIGKETYLSILRIVIAGLYFSFSKRVKKTFIAPLKKKTICHLAPLDKETEAAFFQTVKTNAQEIFQEESSWCHATKYYIQALRENPTVDFIFCWNMYAFFFPITWFIYRRMYLYAFFCIISTFVSVFYFLNFIYVLPARSSLLFDELCLLLIGLFFVTPVSFFTGSFGTSIYLRWLEKRAKDAPILPKPNKPLLYILSCISLLIPYTVSLVANGVLAEWYYDSCYSALEEKDEKRVEGYCTVLTQSKIPFYIMRGAYNLLLHYGLRDPEDDRGMHYMKIALKHRYYLALMSIGILQYQNEDPEEKEKGKRAFLEGIKRIPPYRLKGEALSYALSDAAKISAEPLENFNLTGLTEGAYGQ